MHARMSFIIASLACVRIASAQFECPVTAPLSEALRGPVTEDALRRGVPSGQPGDAASFADSTGFFGNEGLWTLLYTDGRLVFDNGAGFVDYDGALGIKWPWFRVAPGLLAIGGRRLDADAPPARAYVYPYGLSGFQPVSLVFPTPGCWEITGGVGAHRLTFVVEVELGARGPIARYESPLDGLSEGRYYTTSPELWGRTSWTDVLNPPLASE